MSLHFIDLNRQSDTLALGKGLHIMIEVEYISQTNAHRHRAGYPCLHIIITLLELQGVFGPFTLLGVRKGCTRADVIFWTLRAPNPPLLHHIRFEAATFACRYDITTLQCFHRYQKYA
jgi:hypothetical protein